MDNAGGRKDKKLKKLEKLSLAARAKKLKPYVLLLIERNYAYGFNFFNFLTSAASDKFFKFHA